MYIHTALYGDGRDFRKHRYYTMSLSFTGLSLLGFVLLPANPTGCIVICLCVSVSLAGEFSSRGAENLFPVDNVLFIYYLYIVHTSIIANTMSTPSH